MQVIYDTIKQEVLIGGKSADIRKMRCPVCGRAMRIKELQLHAFGNHSSSPRIAEYDVAREQYYQHTETTSKMDEFVLTCDNCNGDVEVKLTAEHQKVELITERK